MNKNVIDAMNSINSIDRLQDEAYLDVHNAIMESQNKYEIIKEHGTVEYAQNEFYQESVLAGVLISLGVIGLIVSTILIIKKVNETSGKGSGKSSKESPSGDVNLLDQKSVAAEHTKFKAKFEELVKKAKELGVTEPERKIIEALNLKRAINVEAYNKNAEALEKFISNIEQFIELDMDSEEYQSKAESLIQEIQTNYESIKNFVESEVETIDATGSPEEIIDKIYKSFEAIENAAPKFKAFDEALDKVKKKADEIKNKAAAAGNKAQSGENAESANKTDYTAIQTKLNGVLNNIGKAVSATYEKARHGFLNDTKSIYSFDVNSLKSSAQSANSAFKNWAEKYKKELGLDSEDFKNIDEAVEHYTEFIERVKNNDPEAINKLKSIYNQAPEKAQMMDELLKTMGVNPASIKAMNTSDEKATNTQAETLENETAQKIIVNMGDPELDNYPGNYHHYTNGHIDLNFYDDELKEQLGKPDGIKNLISARVVKELSKPKNKGSELEDYDVDMIIDYLVRTGEEMGYKPTKPTVEDIKPILQKFMKSEDVVQREKDIQTIKNLASKFNINIHDPESFRKGIIQLRNKNNNTIKSLIGKYNDPNSDADVRGFVTGLFELASLDINDYSKQIETPESETNEPIVPLENTNTNNDEAIVPPITVTHNQTPETSSVQQAATPTPTEEPKKKGIFNKIKSIFKGESYEEYILPSGEMTMVLVEYEITEYEDGSTEKRRIRIINE